MMMAGGAEYPANELRSNKPMSAAGAPLEGAMFYLQYRLAGIVPQRSHESRRRLLR